MVSPAVAGLAAVNKLAAVLMGAGEARAAMGFWKRKGKKPCLAIGIHGLSHIRVCDNCAVRRQMRLLLVSGFKVGREVILR